ncbi:MAG: hypothetical protein ACXWM7_06405 [Parachlamydiaceae bacterium]
MNQVGYITDTHGVKYYSTPSECISNYKNTPWLQKAISIIVSFGALFLYAIKLALLVVMNVERQIEDYIEAPLSDPSRKRLIVCLHGLNGSPVQFKNIVDEIGRKDYLNTDIYIPKILEKGNAKLDEIVSPILESIAKWAKTGEDRELVLIGISNGGRIARAIEAELINSGQIGKIKRLRFISIVGACKGSSVVTLAKKLHLSWILSKNIAEEMGLDSERFKQLEVDWKGSIKALDLKREYIFFASPHDWLVPNYTSSLMEITHAKAQYSIILNHGHNSIVKAVAKSVATMATLPFA